MRAGLSTSIAMCTFNGARFLHDQLDSIGRQTVRPSELVVHDDGSSDATAEIVRSFAARAGFPVRLTINSERLGSARNFGAAIGACTGQVVLLADQDDLWHPQKIETLVRAFESEASLDCLFSDARIIDGEGRATGRTLWRHIGFSPRQRRRLERGEAFELLVVRNVATGATMAFRSHCRDLVLPVPAEHSMVHDRWIALLIAAAGRVECIPEPLIDYRQHTTQQIGPGPEAGAPATRIRAIRESGPAQFREWAGQLQLVRDRLRGRGVPVDPSRLSLLDDRIRHLTARATMPLSFSRRLPPIARELVSGRYHRYSNGALSVVKDLFRAFGR